VFQSTLAGIPPCWEDTASVFFVVREVDSARRRVGANRRASFACL